MPATLNEATMPDEEHEREKGLDAGAGDRAAVRLGAPGPLATVAVDVPQVFSFNNTTKCERPKILSGDASKG